LGDVATGESFGTVAPNDGVEFGMWLCVRLNVGLIATAASGGQF
jgi:hypothetical protein